RSVFGSMELGRKITEDIGVTLKSAFSSTGPAGQVGPSGLAMAMKDLETSIAGVLHAIERSLLPVLMSFVKGLKETTGTTQQLGIAHKETMRSGILEWVKSLAITMTDALTMAVVLVGRAWGGWKLIVAETEAVVNRAFASLITAVPGVLKVVQGLAAAAGQFE